MSDKTKVADTYLTEEVQQVRESAITKLRNAEFVTLPADEYFESGWDEQWNPGGRRPGDEVALITDIAAVGLKKPPMIGIIDGEPRGLQGYLRTRALRVIRDDNPEAFEKHFADGIPVQLVDNLTEEEAYYLACDHDTVARSKMAVIDQGIKMFENRSSELEVVVTLWDEMNQIFNPVSAKSKAKLDAATTQSAREKIMKDVRRGVVQMIHRLYKLPEEVYDAFRNGEENIDPDGPKITQNDLQPLEKANAAAPHKGVKTPEFEAMFEACVDKYGRKGDDSKSPMSAQKLDDFGEGLTSLTLRSVWHPCRYKGHKESLVELDKLLRGLEADGVISAKVFDFVKHWDEEIAAEKAEKAAKIEARKAAKAAKEAEKAAK